VTPEQRQKVVEHAMQTADVSERQVCRYTGFARSPQRYQSRLALHGELARHPRNSSGRTSKSRPICCMLPPCARRSAMRRTASRLNSALKIRRVRLLDFAAFAIVTPPLRQSTRS